MCPRCEGMGSVTDIDLTQLYDETKSLNEGALTIPGYSMDGWYGRIFRGCGFFDPDKPIKKYTKKELHDLLYKEPTKIKVEGINLTYEGWSRRSRSRCCPRTSTRCSRTSAPSSSGRSPSPPARSASGTRLKRGRAVVQDRGINIADACAMQISDLAEWVRGLDEPSVAPLLAALRHTLDSFVEIGLGYLSLDRPSGTLSGGEAQRTKMIRHLGSSLTDVTYVFDEPTIGLHPHDIARMNELLLRCATRATRCWWSSTSRRPIAIADHVVDLGPGAGIAGGRWCFEGTVAGLRASDTLTGRHLSDRAALKPAGATADRAR
jgi:excinuclease UvrABC ATPase subunit